MNSNDGPFPSESAREAAYVDAAIRMTEQELSKAPAGSLNITCVRGCTEYYHRSEKGSGKVYISKKKQSLIRSLAQKDYNLKLLEHLKAKKDILERIASGYPSIDSVYEELSPERQKLVEPIRLTDEQYLEEWTSEIYEGREFQENDDSGFYTEKGERVRSKSEVIIANALMLSGLPYKYEHPLNLGSVCIYPDFTILDMRTRETVYLEHFGMMDNPEYTENFLKKINFYERNGLFLGNELLATFESSKSPLNVNLLRSMLKKRFRTDERYDGGDEFFSQSVHGFYNRTI